MARKDLLKGLMAPAPSKTGPETDPEPEQRVDVARPRYSGGAIGAVSQSIAELKSRSVSDIDSALIDDGGLIDRIDLEDPDHASLRDSIKTHGQQVPILVRPHPQSPGRFQIVYGRRRLAALRDLSLPARALVRDLDDQAVVMAQGQENSARKDLTFIEKVNFARQMRAAGYPRTAICDALTLDKTVISRMLTIADKIPIDVIELIGSAPAVGRDRWGALAKRFDAGTTDLATARDLVAALPPSATSDMRFDTVLAGQRTVAKTPAPPRETLNTAEGKPIARITRKSGALTLTLPRKDSGGFEDWLAEHLIDIHRDWAKARGEET
ncbi:plasmid partitioning protein RepB [Oceaniglobus ichthyenteri]|uniref:plasmid partitioning protein RepB n=1 Tax=Oceaniglobus ichthyenteri TaxID=2136177 RepID=UPI000D3CD2BF|nr:plasmid partitioning protein RepB [Oceaniglobus ichthyenteri]